MSGDEIRGFFDDYVFGFMAADVRREISHARAGEPAGNFLCALGLLCYTEILGGVRRGTLAPGNGRQNFECFFRELGPAYEQLLDTGADVYTWFRCGMAHEYLIKGSSTVTMLKGVEPAGVAIGPDGHRYFCVERYYEALDAAARKLHDDLQQMAGGSLPAELAGR